MATSKAKVVVVGAGMSGVTAAVKLVQNGLTDVVVLEAQDYVGGRIKALNVDNKNLDIGAMFIHGRYGNPVYELAERLGAIIEDGNDESIVNIPEAFHTTKLSKVPNREVEDLLNFMEKSLFNVKPNLEEGLSRQAMIDDAYQQFLRDHEGEVDSEKKELYDAAIRWYCFYEKIDNGCDSLAEVSAWAGQEFTKFKGNYFTRMQGGYSTLINALVGVLPKGVIRTGMPVVNIDWSRPNDGDILVTCENGDVIATDHVIMTISSGCLKSGHTSMFRPSLPPPFIKTLDSIQLGGMGKVFLKWDKPFWDTLGLSNEFLWLESYPLTLTQDKSKRKTKLGKFWWEDIPGVETVVEHETVLLMWLLPHQQDVVGQLEDNEVMAVLHELIQIFFRDVHVPKPTAIYRSHWESNPFVQGGYSYPVLSFKRRYEEHLQLPIPSVENPRLLFAGEAFGLEHMTSVQGAYITGEQQAEKILHSKGITETISVIDAVCSKK